MRIEMEDDEILTASQRRGVEGRRASQKLAVYKLWKSGSCNSCRAPHYKQRTARRVQELMR